MAIANVDGHLQAQRRALHGRLLSPELLEPTGMAKRVRRDASDGARHLALLRERAPRRSKSSTSTDDTPATTTSRTRNAGGGGAAAATTTAADPGNDATAADTVVATTAGVAATTPAVVPATTTRTTPLAATTPLSTTPTINASNAVASSSSPSPASTTSSSSSLSAGAIGGIAFGAVVVAFGAGYLMWRFRHRAALLRRHRGGQNGGAFGSSFGYQRQNDDVYGYASNGSGGLKRGESKDHQSFGNLAGMGDDMGMAPMSEKHNQWDDVGLNETNGAGIGARPPSQMQRGGAGDAGAYYNAPGGHLSSYYGAGDAHDYSGNPAGMPMPPMPPTTHQQAQDDARASIGAMMAMGAIGAGAGATAAAAAGAYGKPLSVVREEDDEERRETLGNDVIPAGQQQTPFGDPPEAGKTFIVRRTFEPSMNDELVILPGDRIQILTSYDDGWCLGLNLDAPENDPSRPNRGVFPRDCVDELVTGGATDLHRVPTLPPLNLDAGAGQAGDRTGDRVVLGFDPSLPNTPAIEVSPAVDDHGAGGAFPASKGAKLEKPLRRASSLIASRDAELFMALGAALDARDAQKK